MRKILVLSLIVVIIIGFTVNISAMGNMYYEEWSELDNQFKEIYLQGIFDGLNITLVGLVAAFEPDKELYEVALEMNEEEGLEVANTEYMEKLITKIDENITDNKSVLEVILKYNLLDEEIEENI